MQPTEHVTDFLTYLERERGASPHTVAAYGRALELARDAFGPGPWAEVGRDDVRAWVASLDAVYAPATTRQRLYALRSFFSYLRRNGDVPTNPAKTVRGPEKERRLPRPLTVDQVTAVLDRVEARARADGRNAVRNLAVLEVAYSTGARVGEVATLDVGDVRLRRREARIQGKGGNERLVPLGRPAVRALGAYLGARGARDGPLWISERTGGRLSKRQLQRLARTRLEVVDGVEEASAHVIRHSTATHLVDAGAELPAVAALLGHASLRTTRRYVRVSVERLKKVHRECHPRGR